MINDDGKCSIKGISVNGKYVRIKGGAPIIEKSAGNQLERKYDGSFVTQTLENPIT